jgi:hypothetical protein
MIDDTGFFIGIVVSILALAVMATTWGFSASTIGEECEKMGQFYVAKKVYECKLKELK